ncbi:MAG TPA: membrane protein insertion efficiency factor YidD [Gemmatimonadetes bacterium]|nr:membrane protein insertion efficiency factor YidD [Gemmatimonadota bacterium]
MVLRQGLIAMVRLYRLAISPWTPAACRFSPSCSSYAIEALVEHGSLRGGWLAFLRIMRCHPWGGHGLDPVPPVRVRASDPARLAQRPETKNRSQILEPQAKRAIRP